MYTNEYALEYLVGEKLRSDRAAAAHAALVRSLQAPARSWRTALGRTLIEVGHRLASAGDPRPAAGSRGIIRAGG